MARIHLNQVGHSYGGGTYALEKDDLVFEDEYTYALLGPSGCGKTTMLNIISGLVQPSEGRVFLDNVDVTNVAPKRRNIAQVFQFPVVYRSKSVFKNLAFPLRCRGWNSKRLTDRVEEVANLLEISDRLGQSANKLRNDEQQLVSLGRGLVREDVAALLMDEPLTVIDPQMKADLRRRIKQASDRMRHTVIYVTHDQNEAMTFADEVLVMRAGKVVQRSNAQELFENPRDTYVGTFIGSPGMNFIPAELHDGGVSLTGTRIIKSADLSNVESTAELLIGIRPEHLTFSKSDYDGVSATVQAVQDHGSVQIVELAIGKATAKMKLSRETPIPSGSVSLAFPSDRVRLYVDGFLLSRKR